MNRMLKESLYWTGIKDPSLRVFDIIMHTERGTTYNSYVLKGSEKNAVFETAKLKFYDEYIESLSGVIKPSDIDYIIVNHTEPDHAGSIENLLSLNPDIKIVGSACAIGFLKHIVNREFQSIAVKDGQTLSLGDKTLRFMLTPNLHWPDTIYTYAEEDKALFTCDSFGAHYSFDGILRSEVSDEAGYLRAAKYYYDNIIGPFKSSMLKALKKIERLPVDMICTGHGPVLDIKIKEIISLNSEWSRTEPNEKKLVVIPYVSAYGYTASLAEKIKDGILESGDIEVRLYDMVYSDANTVLSDISRADGLLFGTPTIVGDALKPIWDLTSSMFASGHGGKLAAAFGSYGWSGEGVPNLTERLKQLKLKVTDGYRVRFKPNDDELSGAIDYGYNFGCLLQGIENKRNAEPEMVKCLICGEIFKKGAERCPVCGASSESFVPVDSSDNSFKKDTDEIFMILGSGAAAFNAANAIRERNSTCNIVMITEDNYRPYNRPMLTKNMFGDLTENTIEIKNSEWYTQNNICILNNKRIVSLNTDTREVMTSDGAKFTYDKCIYALGSEAFIPPFKGKDLPEVVAVRRISDVEKIREIAKNAKNAVVIGGGVLGLEAAWELCRQKINVTVLEASPRLMPGKLDAAASDMIQNLSSSFGINIITSAKTEAIQGDGHVTGVLLNDSSVINADLVIISTGVRANTSIAADAGIVVNRAIVVDSGMRTNAKNVFACGDCAEFKGINYALWSEATEMGRVAGANAAGEEINYINIDPALTVQILDTVLYSIGDNASNPEKKYKTVEFKDEKSQKLEKFFFIDNMICGALLLGNASKIVKISEYVNKKIFYKDIFSE